VKGENRVRRIVTALALGLGLLTGSPGGAWAQSAEAEALGVEVSHSMFEALSLDAIIAKSARDGAGDVFKDIKSRPEWSQYMVEAFQEEVRHDLPVFERILGKVLAREMSVEELKAGVALLKDPSLRATMAAASSGGPRPDRVSKDAERILRTPAGSGFLAKMGDFEKMMEPAFNEFLVELLPGTMRRFGEKAEAGEVRRAAGQVPAVK
jgi:hypothetical protein